jgi:hypothetical protein
MSFLTKPRSYYHYQKCKSRIGYILSSNYKVTVLSSRVIKSSQDDGFSRWKNESCDRCRVSARPGSGLTSACDHRQWPRLSAISALSDGDYNPDIVKNVAVQRWERHPCFCSLVPPTSPVRCFIQTVAEICIENRTTADCVSIRKFGRT